jgi:uncharacterized repeat protein (TIGR03987 family)
MPANVSMIMAAALISYTIGVWSERINGRLKTWHLVFFYLGLICDTVGTGMMFEFVGGMMFDFHGITGLVAIILMLVHAIWATVVLVRKDEGWITRFHTFSILVWCLWLVPYLSPMFLAIVTRVTPR